MILFHDDAVVDVSKVMIDCSSSGGSAKNSDPVALAGSHVNFVVDVIVAAQNDGSVVPPYPESVRAEVISSTPHNCLLDSEID